jgi:hypothetical protein
MSYRFSFQSPTVEKTSDKLRIRPLTVDGSTCGPLDVPDCPGPAGDEVTPTEDGFELTVVVSTTLPLLDSTEDKELAAEVAGADETVLCDDAGAAVDAATGSDG